MHLPKRKYYLSPASSWRSIPWLLKLFVILGICWDHCGILTAKDFSFYHENVLGTTLEMQVNAISSQDAKLAEEAALTEIERLRRIFSTYDPDSDINKFLSLPLGSPRYLPKELIEVMIACDWWMLKSNGAFNPLVEEISDLWRKHEEANTLPSKESINTALEKITQPAWKIDISYEMIERIQEVKLSFNAIAKGYIIDHTSKAAMNATSGIDSVLISIGGDIKVGGSTRRIIGITDPAATADNAPVLMSVQLKNHAIATSGNYERGFEIHNKRYSHIIDPRNGYPVEGEVLSTSVIAPTAAQADALSTTLMVLSPKEGIELIEGLNDTECLLVCENGTRQSSSGFDGFISQDAAPVSLGVPWAAGYELEVAFEINRPDVRRRYHRPYVAVWIENDQGVAVKTLCLWIELGSSWLNKLRRWYRLEKKDWPQLRALSRATRMPGKYRLVWDGTADDGSQLPTGNYTLYIEAVRERGTHGLIREEITLGNKPVTRDLPENVEIKSATLTYGRGES